MAILRNRIRTPFKIARYAVDGSSCGRVGLVVCGTLISNCPSDQKPSRIVLRQVKFDEGS